MSDLVTLLARCRELGAEFTLTPNGSFKVRAPAPLSDELQMALRQNKAKILAVLNLHMPVCSCGTTENTWTVNRGTCWARVVCQQCQGKVAMPTAHLCDPSLPLAAPCKGSTPQLGAGWVCRRCGQPVEIEEVVPSLDGQRTLTLWKCRACLTWGVTPNILREPPVSGTHN